MAIDVLLEDPRWAGAGLVALAVRAAETTLRRLALAPEAWSVSVLGCDDARIRALNAEFRNRDAATNVLSWPSADRAPEIPGDRPSSPDPTDPDLGDIAISIDTCAAEAAAAGRTLDHHTTHLIVHGVLHLLGYDHETDADAALMESLETEILATMGVPNPY